MCDQEYDPEVVENKIRSATNPKELLEAIEPLINQPKPTPAPGESNDFYNFRYLARQAAVRIYGTYLQNGIQLPPIPRKEDCDLTRIVIWCMDSLNVIANTTPQKNSEGDKKNKSENTVIKKSTGRKPISQIKAEKRQNILDEWETASKAGISRNDFCEDKNINLKEFEKMKAWARQRKARGK
jgi:hypothetical protein